MALNIVCGRAGSGKSTLCINSIVDHLELSDKPIYLIVPEQYTMQAEGRLLAHPKCKGLLGNEVLSFKRMAFRVLSRLGGLALPKLNPSGKIMLLNYVVKNSINSLTYFKTLQDRPSEMNRLLSLIDEFGRYEVSPSLIEEASEAAENKNLKSKLNDIFIIYSEYRELLLKEHIDDQDIYSAFLDKLKENKPFANEIVWLDSFAGFTSYEFDIIKELISQCENVYICLCKDEKPEFIFDRVERTYNQLKLLAKEVNVEVVNKFLKTNYRFEGNDEIAHLEKNFGNYPSKELLGEPKRIKILECKNLYTEIDASAREIIRLLRENHLNYGDIAVIARNIESYEKIIKVIYPLYNIPYFIDSKKGIEDHPLIRFIISLLDIVGGNWEYRNIFDFLKTGLYTDERNAVDYLENYILEKGIRGKKEWSCIIENNEGAETIREKLYKDILAFETEFKKCTTLKQCCIKITSFFSDLGIQSKMQDKADAFRESNMAVLADEYARIWNITMEVIEQVYVFLGNTKCENSLKAKSKQLKDILLCGFSEYKIGFIPYTEDSVQVGVADRTRSHNIKAVILLGANEGVLPASFQDNGFLNDSDREYLYNKGVALAEDNRTKANMEYYLIYSVLSSMSDFLLISYPLEGSGGDSMRPSVIVKRIQNLFPDLLVKKDYKLDIIDKVTLPIPFLYENAGLIKTEDNDIVNSIRKWYLSNDDIKDRFNKYMNYETGFKKNSTLPKDVMDELVNRNLYMSASRIEKYNVCPFSYFMTYIIKASTRKENTFETSDVGTFMHSLMDKAARAAKGTIISECDCDKLMDSVFKESLDEIGIRAFSDNERNKYITERLLRYSKEAFRSSVKQMSAGLFVPGGYEASFEENGDFPPIKVKTDQNTEVNISGRIDRYDIYETDDKIYFRVVDYKSSDKSITPGDVIQGQKIQLVAYIDAVYLGLQQNTSKKVIPSAALYYILKTDVETMSEHPKRDEEFTRSYKMNGLILDDNNVLEYMVCNDEETSVIGVRRNKNDSLTLSSKGGIVPPGGFELLRKQLHKTVKETHRRMSSGCFDVSPVETKPYKICDYCEYITICGIDSKNPQNYINFPSIENEKAFEIMGSDD